MKEKWKKTTKEKHTKAERSKGNRSFSERVRAKWFCCAFKLGFLKLICKASIIFKLNLELALSIILKQRELYESKLIRKNIFTSLFSIHNTISLSCQISLSLFMEECRCLKIRDLLSFLICSSILVLKWRQVLPM